MVAKSASVSQGYSCRSRASSSAGTSRAGAFLAARVVVDVRFATTGIAVFEQAKFPAASPLRRFTVQPVDSTPPPPTIYSPAGGLTSSPSSSPTASNARRSQILVQRRRIMGIPRIGEQAGPIPKHIQIDEIVQQVCRRFKSPPKRHAVVQRCSSLLGP
jgi:hypothetical protein